MFVPILTESEICLFRKNEKVCELFSMLWWKEQGGGIVPLGENPLLDKANQWCYFCNSKEHSGRECEEQFKVMRPELLNEEVIKKYSIGREGDLKIG